VTPYFAPAFSYGGPPRSILGLCRALRARGIDAVVLTTSAGAGGLAASPTAATEYEGVPVRYLPAAFPRRLFGAPGLATAARDEAARADVVHVHGLWTLPAWRGARAARGARVPYVMSPRGMLDAGSLARHPRRKQLAYRLVERRSLAGAALLHAASDL